MAKPLRSRKRDIQTLLDAESKRVVVEAYAENEHPVLRFLVGLHPASSSAMLDALILDPLPWMKESVAFNPQAPESLLTRLYEESDVAVHRALACNRACPKPLQLRLASHKDRRVRIHLANHCSDEDIWRALIESADLSASPPTWESQLQKALDPQTTEVELEGLLPGSGEGLREGFPDRVDGAYWPPRGYEVSFAHAKWWLFRRSTAALEDTAWSGVAALHRAIARHPSSPPGRDEEYRRFLPDEARVGSRSTASSSDPIWDRENPMEIPYGRSRDARFWIEPGWLFSLASGLAPAHVAGAFLDHKNADLRAAAAGCLMNSPRVLIPLAFDKSAAVRTALATRPDLNDFLLQVLHEDSAKRVQQQLTANELLGSGAREKARVASLGGTKEVAREGKRSALWGLLRSNDTSSDDIERLSQHDDPCIRYAAGLHQSASSQVLERVSRDSVEWVRIAGGYNPACPADLLQDMARSDDFEARFAVASNSAAPDELQVLLAADPDRRIRYRVANHARTRQIWDIVIAHGPRGSEKSTFEEMLEEALDPGTKSSRLRSLQGGQDLNDELLWVELGEEDEPPRWVGALCVSRAVAQHPNCPIALLSQFGFYLPDDVQTNPSFGLALLERPNLVSPIEGPPLRRRLTKLGTFAYLVNSCIGSSEDFKRRAAARARFADLGRLQIEVFNEDQYVRRELAQRQEINRFMFEALAKDPANAVRSSLNARNDLSRWVQKEGLGDRRSAPRTGAPANERREGERAFATSTVVKGNASTRLKLANCTTDADVLHQLATDGAYKVRLAVAQNDATRWDTIDTLLSDTRDEVLHSALRALVGKSYQINCDKLKALQGAMCRLAGHRDENIRASVAHMASEEETLRKLAHDAVPVVRIVAMRSGRMPEALQLELLETGPDRNEVRRVLARHTRSLAVFKALMEDRDFVHDLGDNHECRLDPETIFRVLENKRYRFVRPSAILSARELPAKEASRVFELLTRAEQELGATVLGLPPELFAQLARDESSELRAAVASNERIPSTLLSGLVRDENEGVRERAARNANLLPEDALFVAQEGAPSLRIQLISSSARLDSDVLVALARRGPQYAAEVARKLLAERGHGPSAWEKGLPLSRLLKRAKVELSARKANALLAEAGILEERTRPSSKDPSRTRAFKALTRVGQEFGYNKESGHAEQTAPVYFPSRFDELAAKYLSES